MSPTPLIYTLKYCITIFEHFFLQVRHDRIVPIFIINLVITDVLQLFCMIGLVAEPEYGRLYAALYHIYFFSLMASVGFIVCVALERYLVIAHPLWYHFSQPIKISVPASVVIWLLPFVYIIPDYLIAETFETDIIFATFHLLPLPFFIFFLAGAIKALSTAIHLTSIEKRRIIGTLVLPLIIYLLLFLPIVVSFLAKVNNRINEFSIMFIQFTPLANSFLYVLIRKGVLDKLLVCPCSKMDNDDLKTVSGSMKETKEICK
uniref:G-protein coupled receptors family 1 profile domain-containing protein n=1 Tax=Sphaeramia orbicularis TaxID=375764 RepID=A0A673B171_9TELE